MFETTDGGTVCGHIDGVRSHVLGIDNRPAESVPVLKRISRDSVRRAGFKSGCRQREWMKVRKTLFPASFFSGRTGFFTSCSRSRRFTMCRLGFNLLDLLIWPRWNKLLF